MKIQIIQQALQSMGRTASEHTAADRIAFRWLKKALFIEYDLTCRLQVLEGAAHQPPSSSSWSHRSRAGLKAATAYFADLPGQALQPDWLVYGDTGMYLLLKRQADRILRSAHATGLTGEDILHNALAGLALDGEPTKKLLYEVGKYLKDKILAGEETPESVAAGVAGNFLKRKALNEILKMRRQQEFQGQTVQDDEQGEIPDQRGEFDITDVILPILSSKGAIGQQLRGLLRQFISTRKEPVQSGLTSWLDQFEQSGSFPLASSMAAQYGVSAQTVTQRWIQPALNYLIAKVQANPKLQTDIARLKEKIEFRSNPAARLASRWMARKRG